MPKKYSELQKAVLSLYRDYLKFGVSKPEPLRSNIIDYAYKSFRANKNLPRRKFNRIEFLLRLETNQLTMWKEANLDNITLKKKM